VLPLPLGTGVLTLQYLVDIIGLLTGREMPFGMEPAEGMPFAKHPHPEELE